MTRILPFLLTAALLPLTACKQSAESTAPDDATPGQGQQHREGQGAQDDSKFEGREVVDNWEAQPGDVTVCPISGRKFEVNEDSGRYEYQGHTFVFCCAGKCLEKVEADPGKYLDALVEEAGGPASDPDPAAGGAIDDSE
jgi:YHS domain-containing protein